MINPKPVTEVSRDDIGRLVSYAVPGMKRPEQGIITGLSYINGMTFVRLAGEPQGDLRAKHSLQWGWVTDLWWDEAARIAAIKEIQAKRSAS